VALIWINNTLALGLCRTYLERKLLHPSQQQKVRERSFTKGKSNWQLMVTCFMVVFYFLYPSLIQQIADINTCDTYDWGGPAPGVPGESTRLLRSDLSIHCGSDDYKAQEVISIFFLLIYGLGIPLSFLLLGTVVKHTAGKQAERQTLAFFMGGFRYKYRYWEIMYMLQKMGIIVIVSFMPRSWPPYFRIYATMLLTATFLLLTQVLQPFEEKCCNALQSLALVTQLATLWMALLWLDPLFAPGTVPHRVLLALFLGLQGLLGCLFIAVTARLLHFHFVDRVRSRFWQCLRFCGRRFQSPHEPDLPAHESKANAGAAPRPCSPREFLSSKARTCPLLCPSTAGPPRRAPVSRSHS
jgi:hypothetical protein